MYLTENETKSKWCPMARVWDGNDVQFIAANKNLGQDAKGQTFCVGSDCMMWRSKDIYECSGCKRIFTEYSKSLSHVSCCEEVIKLTNVGYCGLAGKVD